MGSRDLIFNKYYLGDSYSADSEFLHLEDLFNGQFHPHKKIG